MIAKGKNDIAGVVASKQECLAVYKGKMLVWQFSSSCFGSGGWDNDRPWDNNDGWNNG